MNKELKNLCEYVILNNGIMSEDTITKICKDMNCYVCPFSISKNRDTYCFNRDSLDNYKIAQKQLRAYEFKAKFKQDDNVNSPTHYNVGKIEVIEAIEEWKLNFNLGNAIKYIARCEHKENKKQDLEKAKWYIERELGKCK